MAERRNRRDFTRAEAAQYLSYDPETGIFRWLVASHGYGGAINVGDEAGTIKDGYRVIILFGRQYRAQHLAWLFMEGDWPPADLDLEHQNRNRADNAWLNLRLATRSQNNMNTGIRSNNKSGHKGISWRKDIGKWHARIKLNGQTILLGNFEVLDDAVAVRRAAERQYFGQFAAT